MGGGRHGCGGRGVVGGGWHGCSGRGLLMVLIWSDVRCSERGDEGTVGEGCNTSAGEVATGGESE